MQGREVHAGMQPAHRRIRNIVTQAVRAECVTGV